MFDWLQFLQASNIEYVDSGPSVVKGNVAIRCPFCSDDPSQHMSISLDGHGWRCWRQDHYGRSPVRLIEALTGCTHQQAIKMVYGTSIISSDSMAKYSTEYFHPTSRQDNPRELALPTIFRPIESNLPSAKVFQAYLIRRKIELASATKMGLRYCTLGDFHGRIIFPVYHENRLVTWTGRSIYANATLRYRTLGTSEAIGPISHYLLWFDELMRSQAKTICLCEGPFDALKIMQLGHRYGIVATCFFTSQPSSEQIELLHKLLPRYQKKYLFLDEGTLSTSIRVVSADSALGELGVQARQLPETLKDPGELTSTDELNLILQNKK